MFFPAKESLVFFEELQRREKRVYDDACDVGVVLTPELKAEARHHIVELMKAWENSLVRYGRDNECSVTKVVISIEESDDQRDYYDGVELQVTYHKDPVRKVEFITVEIRRRTFSHYTLK